jgi:MtN3 and saliva related transmembrane protein
MQSSDLLGYAAAALTTVSFVPQVLHTWKTRRAGGLSLGMVALFTLGVALWLAYGIALGAWPVIAANAITLALAVFLLAMKLRY